MMVSIVWIRMKKKNIQLEYERFSFVLLPYLLTAVSFPTSYANAFRLLREILWTTLTTRGISILKEKIEKQ